MKLLPTNFFHQEHFGLSINQTAIRAVSITEDKKISSSSQIQITPNIFDHGVIDKAGLTNALKQLIAAGKFPSKFAAISLPEHHSFSRSHSLPKIPLKDVKEALSWQIEKIFPLPKNQIYFDWKLINQDEKKLDLVIVAVQRKILDDLLEAFQVVGINPVGFEPSATALTRVITLEKNQPAILIEVNPYGSSSTLIENHVASLTVTTQYQPSSQMTDIKDALKATSQSVQSLINIFVGKHQPNPPALKIILAGDSATKELAQWLTSYLNTPVELLNLPGVPPAFQLAYAAATSTILHPDSELSINLLPDKLQSEINTTRKLNQLKSRLKFSFAILFISLLISGSALATVIVQLSASQTQLLSLQSAAPSGIFNAATVSSLNKNSNTIVNLFPNKTTPIDSITTVFDLRPQTILITNFFFDQAKSTINFTGTATDRASLLIYRDSLLDSGKFSQVNIPISSLEKPSSIDFSITLTLAKPTAQ